MYKMLEIDLCTGKAKVKDISDLFAKFIGGTGVLTYLALSEFDEKLDPLSPSAPIFLGIGPFNNWFPSASKTVALFKSPLTGDLGESHAGGRLSMAMYASGFHVLKITGKSEKPAYLSVDNERVEIVSCKSLWGRSALSTERILREKEDTRKGKKSIIRIGPAGERLSPIACVTVDSSRHFGRLGLGAVMGSKNLKAIVISGNRYFHIEDKKEYQSLYNELFKTLAYSETTYKYRDLGTAANVIPLSEIHGLPTRNFSQGFFESAGEISGQNFADNFLVQQISCTHCPIGCIHVATLRELFADPHMYKTIKVSYDHELIYSIGSNLSISKAEDILKLLQFIEKQGWDAISIGVTLAWATEAFQKGIINLAHTNGIVLSFGDSNTYLKVLQNISDESNEFYKDLEKGVYYCAKKYGGEDFAIHFNKNEAPGYMTGINAFVGYSVGVRHSHLDCAGYSIDQKFLGRQNEPSKETKLMYEESLIRNLTNCLVTCLFARGTYNMPVIEKGLKILGYDVDANKLIKISKIVHGMKYLLKEKMGFRFSDLKIPTKLTSVYTSRGLINEKDFLERVKFYAEFIEQDKIMAKQFLSHTID